MKPGADSNQPDLAAGAAIPGYFAGLQHLEPHSLVKWGGSCQCCEVDIMRAACHYTLQQQAANALVSVDTAGSGGR